MNLIFLADAFQLNTISIIILVILLINAIDGLRKGFALTLINLLGLVVAFGGAIMLAKPIGNALYTSDIGLKMTNDVLPYIEL